MGCIFAPLEHSADLRDSDGRISKDDKEDKDNNDIKEQKNIPARLRLTVLVVLVVLVVLAVLRVQNGGMQLTEEDLRSLHEAKQLLEKPSMAVRLADTVGAPLERGFGLLPEKWAASVHTAVNKSLFRALNVAVKSLARGPIRRRSERLHHFAAVASGAAGGAFGLAGLIVELPISTVLMLRSIADIGQRRGEDLNDVEAQLACLEVFALGGRTSHDDAAETGYFAMRAALARSVSEAARYLAGRGVAETGAPALVRFISNIAARFGVAVSEKAAAMAIPVLGAAGGAVINSIFMSHFQDVAHGHFTIRSLERKYGREAIQENYLALPGGGAN